MIEFEVFMWGVRAGYGWMDERKKRAHIKKRTTYGKHRYTGTQRGRCAACLSWYLLEQHEVCPLCGCASVSETKEASK